MASDEAQLRQRIAELEQALAEQQRSALRQQEAAHLFQLLFEHSADAHLIIDGETILDCNQAAVDLLRCASKDELLALRLPALSPPTQPDGRTSAAVVAEVSAIVEARGWHRFEWVHLRADNQAVPLDVLLTIIPHRGHAVAHVIWRDLTRRKQLDAERQRAETALREANRQLEAVSQDLRRRRDLFRALFDGLVDGLLLLDHAGVVRAANQAFVELLHSSPAALLGQPWKHISRRIAPQFPAQLVLQTLRDGRARTKRERYTTADEQRRILDMQTFPLRGAEYPVELVILRVVDSTERVQLEALALQHERFVASSNLAAAVAHEINSPLQAIQTFLYLVDTAPADQRQTYLALAREEIVRLGQIAAQLLDLYRPGAAVYAALDLNRLVERTILLTSRTMAERGIIVACELATTLPPIWGRADQLTQVLLNLIFNALDAMPEGGKLRLCTAVYDHTTPPRRNHQPIIQLTVADSGCGMDAATQAQIFSPFFSTKPDGTGLGLTISQQIIREHGGSISIESAPAVGSTFILRFPLAAERTIRRPPYGTPDTTG